MAYAATYESTDLGTMIVDIVGFFFATIARNSSLIAFLIVMSILMAIFWFKWAKPILGIIDVLNGFGPKR